MVDILSPETTFQA
jgi:hypothetical protein